MFGEAVLSKKRFELVVAHKEVDRPIVDFQAAREIIEGLKTHFQVETEDELLDCLQVDVRSVAPDYIGPPLKTFPDGSKESIFGVRTKEIKNPSGVSNVEVYNPLSEIGTIDDFRERYSFPSYEYFDFEGVKEKVRRYNKYALNTGWMSIWYLYFFLRGMEKAMMDMLIEKEFFRYVMNECANFYKGYMKRVLEEANGAIDYVMTYEDFGSTEGLLISLDDIRNEVLIYYEDFAQIFSNYGARFAFHSCGSVHEVIPDLLNLGVSILDPVQVSAKGMDIELLKEKYGDRLTFRGAIDTTELLPRGTEEEVKEKVKHTVDVLGKDGGYIFCSSNDINADVALENVLAMYEVALGDKFWEGK